jgi:hypothetical protein
VMTRPNRGASGEGLMNRSGYQSPPGSPEEPDPENGAENRERENGLRKAGAVLRDLTVDR